MPRLVGIEETAGLPGCPLLTAGEWALLQGCLAGTALVELLAADPAASEHLTRLITLGLLVDMEVMP